jgi:hypothetical protein
MQQLPCVTGFIMKIRLTLFCLGLAANASAADVSAISTLQAQPLASSAGVKDTHAIAAKATAMHRVPAPSISETSVTRRPDGSLIMNCVQKPNPKLAQQMAAQQSAAHSVEPQLP